MRFTKQRPVTPGFYWVKRNLPVGTPFITIAEFFKSNPLISEVDSIAYCGNLYTANDENFLEFAGPLEMPKDG